ncbi:polyadenylate-binding protein 1, partial [Tanacetum coccineum]
TVKTDRDSPWGAGIEAEILIHIDIPRLDDSSSASATQAEKEEADARSIYVGNVRFLLTPIFILVDCKNSEHQVDYACTPEEVQQHFQSCGTVNRVTILTDKFGQPKGFAYVEFVELEAVQNAVLLNESELHGRQLKVAAKRTNVPGLKQFRGRRANPYFGFPSRRPYMPGPPIYSPYGYGKVKFLSASLPQISSAAGPNSDRVNKVEEFQEQGDQCGTGHTNPTISSVFLVVERGNAHTESH